MGWTPDFDRNCRTWFLITKQLYRSNAFLVTPSYSMMPCWNNNQLCVKNLPKDKKPPKLPNFRFRGGAPTLPLLLWQINSLRDFLGVIYLRVVLFHFFQSLQLLLFLAKKQSWKQTRYLGRKVSPGNEYDTTCLFHGWGWRNSFSFDDRSRTNQSRWRSSRMSTELWWFGSSVRDRTWHCRGPVWRWSTAQRNTLHDTTWLRERMTEGKWQQEVILFMCCDMGFQSTQNSIPHGLWRWLLFHVHSSLPCFRC